MILNRFIIAVVLFFVALSFSWAQENGKFWSQGKLTWEDFKEKTSSDAQISHLNYTMGFKREKNKFNDTVVVQVRTYALMNRDSSWIHPAYKNEQSLRYNQVLFNIVELYRREFQSKIYHTPVFLYPELLKYMLYECNESIQKVMRELDYGNDELALNEMEEKTNRLLRHDNDIKLSKLEMRNFGYGMFAGVGGMMVGGNISQYFSSKLQFVFGFDFSFKKSHLLLHVGIGGGRVLQSYNGNELWPKDKSITTALGDISYGYNFLNTSKIRLTPFAGLGFVEFSIPTKDDEQNIRMVSSNAVVGISTLLKLRTRFNLIPNVYTGTYERVETSLQFRVYGSHSRFNSDLGGFILHFSVSLRGFGNGVRIK